MYINSGKTDHHYTLVDGWIRLRFSTFAPVVRSEASKTRKRALSQRSNTLQHTATHCNTLQHRHRNWAPSQRSNPLQHTATHCNIVTFSCASRRAQDHTLQHTATTGEIHCNKLQQTATTNCIATVFLRTSRRAGCTLCNTLQHSATHSAY
jgi:kynurenine formamidase